MNIELRLKWGIWVVDNLFIPSWAAPWIIGLFLGRWPRKVDKDD